MRSFHIALATLCLIMGSACQNQSKPQKKPDSQKVTSTVPATQSNSELTLPDGFKAQLMAEGIGPARHLSVRANGDIYVRLSEPQQGHCLAAFRPQTQTLAYFGSSNCGTGLEVQDEALYFSTRETVFRQNFHNTEELVPSGEAQVIAKNLGAMRSHSARSLALDNAGHLYVNVGAPSNACQENDRQSGSAGQDPCSLLNEYGGIYQFSSSKTDQDKLKDGIRYATGVRNAVALAWNPRSQGLYLVQHGRDQLNSLYPELYNDQQNAELPAEEFARMDQGADLGWPYCYYDPQQKLKVLAPEYGGDGKNVGRCAKVTQPLIGFPAHYAPNDLLFYTGQQFPERYHHGAFIAFHGSWNRGPLEQKGYNVVFAPMQDGQSNGEWEVFADGFAGMDSISNPGQAKYRPMGLAIDPEGSLLVIDSKQGRLWKIQTTSPS